MIKTAYVLTRDRQRVAEIATIVTRFGFGHLLAGIPMPSDVVPKQPTPERARAALQELGPTFVKLGQILATRGDLFPPEWVAEFEKLQDDAAVVDAGIMIPRLNEALGQPASEVFEAFDEKPIAAASIGQVYAARLHDGRKVVLKLRRPGIRRQMEADLRILLHIAELAEQNLPDVRRYRPGEIVRLLSNALLEELDFTAEARNTETLADAFAQDRNIVVPAIHWPFTSERLLVQDRLSGVAVSDAKALSASGLDRALLARRGAEAFLKAAFEEGLFHADPHPGNLFCLAGNRVGFIDFGMIGRLSSTRRSEVVQFIGAVIAGDGRGVRNVMIKWGGAPEGGQDALTADADAFAMRNSTHPFNFANAMRDFTELGRRHHLPLPPDLALFIKALLTAEGSLRRLDPGLDVIALAGPIVRRSTLAANNPATLAREGLGLLLELRDVSKEAPHALRSLFSSLAEGRLKMHVQAPQMDELGVHVERAATKLAVAIVAGAFALGLAPKLFEIGPSIWGVPAFLGLGVLAVVAACLWIVFKRG